MRQMDTWSINQFLRKGTNPRTAEYGVLRRIESAFSRKQSNRCAGQQRKCRGRSRVIESPEKTLLGLYVVNGGYDGPRGEEAVQTGCAEAVAYGRALVANPGLPRRLQLGAALNEPTPSTFYGGGAAG